MPKKEDVEACTAIRDRIKIPLIADIHYDYRMALACLDAATPTASAPSTRSGSTRATSAAIERFKEVVRKARDKGVPMRIGVNSGSLEKDLIEKYGFPCPEAMVESALRSHRDRRGAGLSRDDRLAEGQPRPDGRRVLHASSPRKADYPTHVGITEAGSREYGTLKSAAGIGAIVLRGIGDTIRVSLLGDPVPEIAAGFDILRACDRRVNRPEVVACPTCGRLDIDLERIVAEVEAKMAHLKNPLRISILGCLVNGFGEAKEADIGIAAGGGKGMIFKRACRSATSRRPTWSRPSSKRSSGSTRTPPPSSRTRRRRGKPALPVLN